MAANVADDDAVRAMVARTVEALGGLDVLVNNAGTTHFVPHVDLDGLSAEVWDEILAVNLKGTFFACRAAMPHLKGARGTSLTSPRWRGWRGRAARSRTRRRRGR